MLHCILLMGNLFVSDGQVMIAAASVSRIERAGSLLLIGTAGREDGLDVSNYPPHVGVHTILADCAAKAEGQELAGAAFSAGRMPGPDAR